MKAENIKFSTTTDKESSESIPPEGGTVRKAAKKKGPGVNPLIIGGCFVLGFSAGALFVVISEDEDITGMIDGAISYGRSVIDGFIRGDGLEAEQESEFQSVNPEDECDDNTDDKETVDADQTNVSTNQTNT